MDRTQAILDAFQTDLRSLSAEAKKKHPPLKDVSTFILFIFDQNVF